MNRRNFFQILATATIGRYRVTLYREVEWGEQRAEDGVLCRVAKRLGPLKMKWMNHG